MKKNEHTILIKNADYIVTMDKINNIFKNASLFIVGDHIDELDTRQSRADTVIDGRGKIVLPGFVNCHHHMFQCGLRGNPELQNQSIDKWIKIVCQFAQHADEELIYYSSLANMAELLLYGCTTTSDMHYIFPKRKKNFIEATIRAAKDIGIRFHPYRGSLSLSRKDGAMFPDDVTQTPDAIVRETEDTIKKFHDDSPHSMLRIGIAPCTIFTSRREDYENAATLSKKYNVNMQTHLSESEFENDYSLRNFNQRPYQYLSGLGWSGERVSFTHCIHVNADEIASLAKTKTNVVYCPISNAREPVGESGIAPVWEMLKAKVNVGVGVDGSAGNDSSNMLEELRWARTIQGARSESTYLKSYDVLKMGTQGGAKVLRWDKDIGSLEKGKAADIVLFNRYAIESAGAIWDPVGSLIANQARRANLVMVNGRVVVQDGKIQHVNEDVIVESLARKVSSK